MYLGKYPPSVIGNEGNVEVFIERFIAPMHVRPGEPDVAFIVERFDKNGRAMSAPTEHYFAAPIGPYGAAPNPLQLGPPGGFPAMGSSRPVDTASPLVERFQTEVADLKERIKIYEDKLQKREGSMAEWSQLADQQQRLRELQKEIGEARQADRDRAERDQRERAERLAAPPPQMFGPQGFGGLMESGPPAPPPRDMLAEALVKVVERATMPQPVPAPLPVAPVADPLQMLQTVAALVQTMMPKPVAPVGIDPLIQRMLDEQKEMIRDLKTKLDKPGEKIGDTIGTIKEVLALSAMMGGNSEAPSQLPDIINMLGKNADKIGAGLRFLLNGVGSAPRISPPAQAAPQVTAAAAPTPAAPPPPAPPEVAAALLVMGAAPDTREGDQLVLDKLYEIIAMLGMDPKQRPIATKIGERFLSASSKPELRHLVTSICTWTGDKSVTVESLIERTTLALHRNYSFLYKDFTKGKEKILADAHLSAGTPPVAAPTPAEAPAAPLEEEDEDGVYEGDEGDEEDAEPAVQEQ